MGAYSPLQSYGAPDPIMYGLTPASCVTDIEVKLLLLMHCHGSIMMVPQGNYADAGFLEVSLASVVGIAGGIAGVVASVSGCTLDTALSRA